MAKYAVLLSSADIFFLNCNTRRTMSPFAPVPNAFGRGKGGLLITTASDVEYRYTRGSSQSVCVVPYGSIHRLGFFFALLRLHAGG